MVGSASIIVTEMESDFLLPFMKSDSAPPRLTPVAPPPTITTLCSLSELTIELMLS